MYLITLQVSLYNFGGVEGLVEIDLATGLNEFPKRGFAIFFNGKNLSQNIVLNLNPSSISLHSRYTLLVGSDVHISE